MLVLAALLFGAVLVVTEVTANAATTITPEKVTRIRNRCVENQAALNRLQTTDAFLRNDRGNLYRTIADKLMVPLNRRIASNSLDAGPLLTITSDYDDEYSRFFDAYVEYDNALTKLRSTDCDREPVAFYNALLDARDRRIKLSASNQAIRELIRQYGLAFTNFKTEFEKENP